MNTNPVIINSLDGEVWRKFVDRNPHGNIFHTPEMFQVFARTRGYCPLLWAAIADDGQVLAILTPVQVTLKDGLLRRLTTRSIVYGSVLCTPDSIGIEALAHLLKAYTKKAGREALFTELRNLSDLSVIQPVLDQCGFVYEDHLDYLIDLNCSPEQLLQSIGSRTRKHIRKGLRDETMTVEQVTSYNQISDWYDVIQKTYFAAHVPLADRSLFEAAFDILQPRGMVIFWLAYLGPTPVAASAELLYKDVMYGWYGGVDRQIAKDSQGELLMWHILEWGTIHGYKIYDFGGAGKPGEEYGVRDFKAKFGGQLVSFGRNACVHAPLSLAFSRIAYPIYRQLIRH